MIKYILIACFLIHATFTIAGKSNFKINSEINNTKEITQIAPQFQDHSPLLRFESEIKSFEAQDKQNGYFKNCILFTGSSSIRKWTSLSQDMKDLPVLNRGFGGSTIPEVLYYANRYIFQQAPQIIVFYCGENDIAAGDNPKTVFNNFKLFVNLINSKLPQTKIIYLSMKPSIARWNLWYKFQACDQMIKKYIDTQSKISYINSSLSMLKNDGTLKTDIFIEDGLHMNKKGYRGWTQQLIPILKNGFKK